MPEDINVLIYRFKRMLGNILVARTSRWKMVYQLVDHFHVGFGAAELFRYGQEFMNPKYAYGSDEAESFMTDATHFATNEINVLTIIY